MNPNDRIPFGRRNARPECGGNNGENVDVNSNHSTNFHLHRQHQNRQNQHNFPRQHNIWNCHPGQQNLRNNQEASSIVHHRRLQLHHQQQEQQHRQQFQQHDYHQQRFHQQQRHYQRHNQQQKQQWMRLTQPQSISSCDSNAIENHSERDLGQR